VAVQDHALWAEFGRSRDAGARAALAEHYLGFARIMAGKLYAGRTVAGLEFDDYLQFARVGLLESIDRYDARQGAKFETYAALRIQGAILNGIQSYSELQEQVAARKRILGARVDSLGQQAPDGRDMEDTFAHLAEVAIGLAVGFALEGTGMYHAPGEAALDETYSGVELRQLGQRVLELVRQLPQRQRDVLTLHYMQQFSFEEVAARLELSRGRVSQLHQEGLAQLRQRLRRLNGEAWSF
jgi:RNA polymerase sigma factor for flagellar operon FliA